MLRRHVSLYLERCVERVAPGHSYVPEPNSGVCRFFFIALLSTEDRRQPGTIDFFFTGRQLAEAIGAGITRVAVGLVDADHPVKSIAAFLRPRRLQAPHHWSVTLQERVGETLIERWQQTGGGASRRSACAQLRAYLLWETLGVHTMP